MSPLHVKIFLYDHSLERIPHKYVGSFLQKKVRRFHRRLAFGVPFSPMPDSFLFATCHALVCGKLINILEDLITQLLSQFIEIVDFEW